MDRHVFHGDFYDPAHLKSYGRNFMISVGSRSVGKSTNWLIEFVLDYIEYGKKFIYQRRTDDETFLTVKKCCFSVLRILQDHWAEATGPSDKYQQCPLKDIVVERGTITGILQDDTREEIGCYVSVSNSYKMKSTPYGDMGYRNILYDEIINLDPSKYLGTHNNIKYEFDRCMEFFATVDRDMGHPYLNETKYVFVGNLYSYFNPIFIGFGIDKYISTEALNIAPKGKMWVLEQTKTVRATEQKSESVLFKVLNEQDRDYNFENRAFDENFIFTGVNKNPRRALFNIAFKDETYGVYYIEKDKCMYISRNVTSLPTYALETSAQGPSATYMVLRASEQIAIQNMKKMYYMGNLQCENRGIRYRIANYFMLTP